jgi:hypothetical protein
LGLIRIAADRPRRVCCPTFWKSGAGVAAFSRWTEIPFAPIPAVDHVVEHVGEEQIAGRAS